MNSNDNRVSIVLENELRQARSKFENKKSLGLLQGEFDDIKWKYKGCYLIFCQIDSLSTREEFALSGVSASLARCFAIHQIAKELTPESLIGHLNGFRWLEVAVREKNCLWHELNKNVLNYAIKNIEAKTSYSTSYNRAGAIAVFVDYLNRVRIQIDGENVCFCNKNIVWRHGVKNPIRENLDPTSERYIEKRKKLFKEDVHIALGKARATIRSNIELEPKPGYDLIRLESIGLVLCTGMRIGELCAIPVNALEIDTDTGLEFLRVPVEKGAGAKATTIPDVWVPLVRESYAYLLETCASARKRAAEIEKSGFTFVVNGINEVRSKFPLAIAKKAQLKSIGLDPSKYALISEFTAAFDLSEKEFTSGGRFYGAIVEVPRIVASLLVSWIDERFFLWDWNKFSKNKFGVYKLSVNDMANLSGASKSSVCKAHWFYDCLRNFLDSLLASGVFEPNSNTTEMEINLLELKWKKLRSKMISLRGGGQCSFVDVDVVQNILSAQYARWLEMHFKETLDSDPNGDGAIFECKNSRDGVPNRLSEHLIVVWEHQFNKYNINGILPRPILRSDYYNYLSSNAQKETIFQRLSIFDSVGNPFSITPHSIRRWLTTAVLRSGPSQAAIDLWMGRQIGQSRVYDYRTANERAEYVRSNYLQPGVVPDDFIGRQVSRWRLDEISDEQIMFLVTERLKAVHFTPWGSCSKELYISPCSKGLACLRGFGSESMCSSFHIDVSDLSAMKEIIALRDNYEKLYRSITPRIDELNRIINNELNTVEPLDQHLIFIRDMIRGCNSALDEYEKSGVNISCDFEQSNNGREVLE
ncbi:hypothetical protein [Deefgea rivuli]|uniref:hypothetical protein n=1 Tax=Deefgea rivuli TaxID=400948 RepID=UPI0006848A29|nr:hypothetical protein [Deefgea rivuli]